MTSVDIQGRDLGSATGGTGLAEFAPVNLGFGAGALASGSAGGGGPSLLVVAASTAVLILILLLVT